MVKDGIFLGERYQVLSKLGAGGMADVYRAKDCMLNRYVAVKVLKKEYREDENFVKKFRSEAQAAAGLLNPNIVNVYDVGEDRGLYYMVMELVEGITLKEYIQRKGKLSTSESISIAIQMCTGIEAAHKHHIIHRDIKPQNIIISKEGKVKVTDFGIARATTSNTVSSSAMGSVHYVSPEQARGGYCDAKSDIYSAGITMYEMVTGQVPFDGDSTVTVAMKHLQENITPPSELVPDVSRALEKIILKCTQKSPERRYQNTGELIQDLKRALVDPEGEFVNMVPIRSIGDTVIISPEDMGRLKSRYDEDDDYEEEDDYDYGEDDYDEDGYDEDDYDEDEDSYGRKDDRRGRKGHADDVNPKMNRMMKILTVVVAVILVFTLVFIIGQAAGVFRIPESTKTEQTDSKVTVPKLVGEKQEVAEEMCKKKNLQMKVVKQQHSDEYKAGYVIEQKTKAGDKVKKKTVIEVVVSSGAEEKTVPDVSGMDEDAARAELKKNGFTKQGTPKSEYHDSVEKGKVIRTTPAAGETAAVSTEIVLVISKGADKKSVPDIEGMYVQDAVNALAEAGLSDGGTSAEEYDESVPAGCIIKQNVASGKKVEKGTSVSYVVSMGPKPAEQVSVPPNLTGSSLAGAKSALSNVGLNYQESWEASDKPYGQVLGVSPGEGSSVEVGTTVTIRVSDGSLAAPPSTGGTGGNTGNTGEEEDKQ